VTIRLSFTIAPGEHLNEESKDPQGPQRFPPENNDFRPRRRVLRAQHVSHFLPQPGHALKNARSSSSPLVNFLAVEVGAQQFPAGSCSVPEASKSSKYARAT